MASCDRQPMQVAEQFVPSDDRLGLDQSAEPRRFSVVLLDDGARSDVHALTDVAL
jgi:hypothetical protein